MFPVKTFDESLLTQCPRLNEALASGDASHISFGLSCHGLPMSTKVNGKRRTGAPDLIGPADGIIIIKGGGGRRKVESNTSFAKDSL